MSASLKGKNLGRRIGGGFGRLRGLVVIRPVERSSERRQDDGGDQISAS